MEGEREMVLTSLALVKIRNFPKTILKTPLPGSVPRLLLSRVFFSLNAYDFTQNGGQESGHLELTKPCGSLLQSSSLHHLFCCFPKSVVK